MGIQAGKLATIYDDDPRLAAVWKGAPGSTTQYSSETSGGGDDDSTGSDPGGATRPQLNDIIFKGFESYDDSFGVQKVKAKFRIYNSSKSEIDGFAFALTLPDQQGGRS
jgi:hypothetical protein